MSEFWGYTGADTLAILVISAVSFMCLICARVFVSNYGK
jgi:hypothetical protein